MECGMSGKQPVSLLELKCRLLELNQKGDIPFSVVEQKNIFIAS